MTAFTAMATATMPPGTVNTTNLRTKTKIKTKTKIGTRIRTRTNLWRTVSTPILS